MQFLLKVMFCEDLSTKQSPRRILSLALDLANPPDLRLGCGRESLVTWRPQRGERGGKQQRQSLDFFFEGNEFGVVTGVINT